MEPMINIALRAARKAGENIVRASDDLERFEIRAKGVNNFVSDVDIAAEKVGPCRRRGGEELSGLPS